MEACAMQVGQSRRRFVAVATAHDGLSLLRLRAAASSAAAATAAVTAAAADLLV